MTPARLEEIRAQAGVGGMTWHDRDTVRELLNYIAQLEAQRGGAVVVAEPTPDEWREIAAKAIGADLVDFLSGAAAYGLWLRGKIPQAIPAIAQGQREEIESLKDEIRDLKHDLRSALDVINCE